MIIAIKTRKDAQLMFEKNPNNIKYIPQRFLNKKMCDTAFSFNTRNIEYIPERFITLSMCYDAVQDPSELCNLAYIPEKYITQEMCNMAVEASEYNLAYVPDKFITEEMCKRAFKRSCDNIRYIPERYLNQEMCNRAVKENEYNLAHIPDKYITQDLYLILIRLNLKYLKQLPEQLKTQTFYIKVIEVMGVNDSILSQIPDEYKSEELYNRMYELNPNNIAHIPKSNLTKEMCEEAFKQNPNNIAYIPEKYITQEMCNIAMKENANNVRFVPKQFQTQEMWNNAVTTNWFNIYDVPEEYQKQAYIIYLKKNIYWASISVPITLWDDDIFSVVYVELKKLMEKKEKIHCNSNLCLYVVRLYPELDDVLDKGLKDYIRDELYALLTNGSTVERIAEKYQVEIQYINDVLESINEYDMEGYKSIKRVLAQNKQNYFFDIMNDVYKLGEIILSLGYINTKFLNIEQKLKFAYLCNKHVHHSLEEIYNFNYKKYDNNYAKVLDKFFKQVLKYNYLADDYTMIPEKKTILFNNSWLKKYDRDKFFGIKNGVPTIESKFGKNETVLTLEIEQGIINILIENEIPLNDIIVRTAFREYFNGTLSEYVTKLQEYDNIFEGNKPKKLQ